MLPPFGRPVISGGRFRDPSRLCSKENCTKNAPEPDRDAVYAGRIVLDLNEITPHVSGPDTVQVMQSLAEMEKKKVAIQKAYLLSCLNSRIEDLEAAERVLRGKKVAPGVKFYL